MHFIEKEPSQKRIDFDQKLKSNKILRVPGAYNPLTAKLIEEIGYDAVYVSGGVMANDLGFPDIGLTTLQDVSTRSYLISRVTNLPTIVDIDTGFKSCKETIETKGWEPDPFDGLKILKGEMDYYYDSDPEIQKSEEKVQYWKTVLETLSEIIDNLKWRHQTISNIIKWKQFESGN